MHGENCIIHDLVFKTLKSDFIGLPDRKSPIQAKIILKVLPAANIYFHPFCVLFFLSLWAFELVFSSWGCWYFGFDFFFFNFHNISKTRNITEFGVYGFFIVFRWAFQISLSSS